MNRSLRGAAVLLAVAGWMAALAAAGCAVPPWLRAPPEFPAQPTSWDLPLFEPLTQLTPRLLATAVGAPAAGRASPAAEEVLLVIDSGSSHTGLPASTFRHLGLGVTTSHLASIEDAAGVERAWSGAVVPEIRFGDRLLALRNVVASADDAGSATLGADVLSARGWEIDADRGLLVLGPTPWPSGPEVIAAPTTPWRVHAIVDLQIGGGHVPVLLDTASLFTVIQPAAARELGLADHLLAYPLPIGSAYGFVKLERAVDGELRLGGRNLGRRTIPTYAAAGGGPGKGMLGSDVLSSYVFQVTAAGLRLRPRGRALVETAAARVARWVDLPRCPEAPGCVIAELGPGAGAAAPVHVRVLATHPRAARFLFGCLDGQGRLRPHPLWLEVGLRRPTAGDELDLQPGAPGPLRRAWAAGCDRLTLLDVNPVIDAARPLSADAEARLTFEARNHHVE